MARGCVTVRVPGIKRYYKKKSRVWYTYYRPTNTRILAEYGSPDFFLELAALRAKFEKPAEVPGSLGALIDAYRRSPDWSALRPATRKSYDRVHVALKPLRGMPLAKITRPLIIELRDTKIYPKRGRWMANYVVTVLSILMLFAKDRGWNRRQPACRKGSPACVGRRTVCEPSVVGGGAARRHRARAAATSGCLWRSPCAPGSARRTFSRSPCLMCAMAKSPSERRNAACRSRSRCIRCWPKRSKTDQTATQSRSPSTRMARRGRVGVQRLVAEVQEGAGSRGRYRTWPHAARSASHARNVAARGRADDRTIADVLGQKSTSMARHYSENAQLPKQAQQLVVGLDLVGERLSPIGASNAQAQSVWEPSNRTGYERSGMWRTG